MTIAELLEASREREQSFDNIIDALRASTPIELLRFAVNVTAALDKGSTGEAFALLASCVAREEDALMDSFRALNKEDRVRVTAKVLHMVEQDKLAAPRKRSTNGHANGETSVTDLILNAIQASKTPMTRVEIIAKVQETLPDVNETTIRSIVSAKKADGTLRHHEEQHAYSMA